MTTETKPKIAPHSKESEMMILGCMFTSNNAFDLCVNQLSESDFYYNEHKTIFQALKKAHLEEKPADVHLICEELKRQGKLNEVNGTSYIISLVQFAGTSAYVEEYVQNIKNKSLLRSLLECSKKIEKAVLDNPENGNQIIDDLKKDIDKISKKQSVLFPIISINDRIDAHHKNLERYRGKKYLGLCVKSINELNDKMLGLRKLILIAAAPNVGKTALTIQLAQEVLLEEPEACLLYVSLEMSAEEIFTRMHLYISELDFNTYVLGSQQANVDDGYQNLFSKDEMQKISDATNKIREIGDRLQIIDMSSCPHLSADWIIRYVDELKSKTMCSRVIVVIDYLQVWPISPNIRLSSEIETDKWRIGEMKKIRDALQSTNQDPVIVISEARKPSGNDDVWGGDLSDVMGSARGTYTPDAVLLLNHMKPKQLNDLWKKMGLPQVSFKDESNSNPDSNDNSIKDFLASKGIALCTLNMPKGRDGMKRFSLNLAFHFQKNRFEPIKWQAIRKLTEESLKKK